MLARFALILLSIAMLSLSFAPVHQFFFVWFALVPLMLVIRSTGSGWRALLWGWIAGVVFFAVNMWWLVYVTGPGLLALTAYLGLFWGFAAVIFRFLLNSTGDIRPRSPILSSLALATAWVGIEWLRGNVSFLGRQGLPWLFLGQSQSPLLVMCQIADIFGVYGVTWWIILVNATIALLFIHRSRMQPIMPTLVMTAFITLVVAAYGIFRMSQATTSPGPTILLVQSNYPQSNTGEKGASAEEIVSFHLSATRAALAEASSRGQKIDLVVWSETMMPPLNPEARYAARGTQSGALWQDVFDALVSLTRAQNVCLLTGGIYHADWHPRDDQLVPLDRRNSAYIFTPEGVLASTRYDKIHLVPFGEYIPFQHSIPLLYKTFVALGPNYYEEYVLTPGREATVFEISDLKFVVPICFEDIVPDLVARMLRGQSGSKGADFIVNITNDGWFRGSQMSQHLQAATFRSIENRAPTARSVNTGISGFIDSVGRTSHLIAAGTEGTAVSRIMLDRRVTLYTRIGDVFALACVGVTLGLVGWMILGRLRYNKGTSTEG